MNSSLPKPTALDFFSGSGLVTEGLRHNFDVIWANDYDPGKNRIYQSNFKDHKLDGRSISCIKGSEVPVASLAWSSFPCQDLSLAGNMRGISNGQRSSLFWEWLRVLDQMAEMPPVLAIENVVGFLLANKSGDFRSAYYALKERGYVAGGFILNAIHFVPQSRPRSFLIAVKHGINLDGLILESELLQSHPEYFSKSMLEAHSCIRDAEWVWWKLPSLPHCRVSLDAIFDSSAPVDSSEKTEYLLSMLSSLNRKKLQLALRSKKRIVGTGYKRVRREAEAKCQRLELRFDGIAGCLRTPNGGSSRQIVIIVENGKISTRLLTAREAARLMGAKDCFRIPGTYNEAYRAMGDGVAVPVTCWLAEHLLAPLTTRALAMDREIRVASYA